MVPRASSSPAAVDSTSNLSSAGWIAIGVPPVVAEGVELRVARNALPCNAFEPKCYGSATDHTK
eukprot:2490433-Pyramimonas_sp.AAC.1